VTLEAWLERSRVAIQVDIGFGDAIWPEATVTKYPTLLDQPASILRAYPKETVVAEKYQAMVRLGIANSRMKDFYDLWTLARFFEFDGQTLATAIQATFLRRHTPLPPTSPLALTTEFTEDANKLRQWAAFLQKGSVAHRNLTLLEVADCLKDFLLPPTEALINEQPFSAKWSTNNYWT